MLYREPPLAARNFFYFGRGESQTAVKSIQFWQSQVEKDLLARPTPGFGKGAVALAAACQRWLKGHGIATCIAGMKHLVSLGCPEDAQVGLRGSISQTSSNHLLEGGSTFLPVLSSSLLLPLQVTPGTNPS